MVFNNNKLLWGVSMLLLNLGSRHVAADLGRFHERVLASELAKKVILFAMFFVATRDVLTSFILCVVYVLVVDGLFHERRKFSVVKDMVPDRGNVSEAEYKRAKEVVTRYQQHVDSGNSAKNEHVYETYLQNLSTLRV